MEKGYLPLLGIYEDAINSAIDTAADAVEQYAPDKLNDLHKLADDDLTITFGLDDITNKIILAYFLAAKWLIEEKTGAEVDCYINCDDSHLYVDDMEV